MNPSEKKKILNSCHCDPTSGHLGVRKTLSRITDRFMWTGVTNDENKMNPTIVYSKLFVGLQYRLLNVMFVSEPVEKLAL